MTCRHCVKALRGIHPDIAVLDRLPDKREIVVDQIRELREDAVVLPNDADMKVYIIHHAECLNASAQNALLKLLEEPPSFVVIILSVTNPAVLLDTVRSRCVEAAAGQAQPDLSDIRDILESFFAALTDSSKWRLSVFVGKAG
jgi:DNA polymerase III gamma/tau subunit